MCALLDLTFSLKWIVFSWLLNGAPSEMCCSSVSSSDSVTGAYLVQYIPNHESWVWWRTMSVSHIRHFSIYEWPDCSGYTYHVPSSLTLDVVIHVLVSSLATLSRLARTPTVHGNICRRRLRSQQYGFIVVLRFVSSLPRDNLHLSNALQILSSFAISKQPSIGIQTIIFNLISLVVYFH